MATAEPTPATMRACASNFSTGAAARSAAAADGPVVGEIGRADRVRRLSVRAGSYFVRGRGADVLLEGEQHAPAGATVTVEPSATVHTRMFAPSIGILEDPATGSASGALGAYLVQNGVVDIAPTTEIIVEQGYEIERPAQILVRVESDDDIIQSVKVGGQCVMVVEGTLRF